MIIGLKKYCYMLGKLALFCSLIPGVSFAQGIAGFSGQPTCIGEAPSIALPWYASDVSVAQETPALSATSSAPFGTSLLSASSDAGLTNFAVYSSSDESLTFYRGEVVPEAGDKYEGKAVTAVYTGFDTGSYSASSAVAWSAYRSEIRTVAVASEGIAPRSTAYWFYGCDCTSADLSKLDMSKVISAECMFYDCDELTSLDTGAWDTENLRSAVSMFYNCSKLRRST